MKKYLLLALLPFLYACSDSPNRSINYDEAFAKDTQGLGKVHRFFLYA